jgi:flagellar protein FlaG
MAINSIDGVAGAEPLVREAPKALVTVRELKPLVEPSPASQRASSTFAANGGSGAQANQAPADGQAQTAAQERPQQQVPSRPSLRFSVDQDTGKTVVALLDQEGQVVRQMPTEEALEVAKAIGRFQGMFVNLKV